MLNENSLSTASCMTSGPNSPYFWGIEYNIVPLSRNLDQRGNDRQHCLAIHNLYDDKIYRGQKVRGISFSDNGEHIGKVVAVINNKRQPDVTSAVVIIDDETRTLIRLVPDTVEKYSDAVAKQSDMKTRFRWSDIIKNDILKESDGQTVEVSDEELDLTIEEQLYRDEVIDEYKISKNLIDYLDRKFMTDTYVRNYILIESIPFSALSLMGAETKGTIISDTFWDLLKVYLRLTGQYVNKLKGYMNRNYIVDTDGEIRIRSWREVYLMCHAIKVMWRRLRWSDRYTPAGMHAYDNWNANTENDVYRNKMGNFIEDLVKLQLPEEVRRGETTEKCFTILNPDE